MKKVKAGNEKTQKTKPKKTPNTPPRKKPKIAAARNQNEKRERDKVRKGRGRPSDYRPEYADQAFGLTLLGATDQDLAFVFGVSDTSIDTWKLKHPEFLGAITRGKHHADAQVGKALYDRAIGFEWQEDIAVKIRLPDRSEDVKVVTVTRRAPPDTVACIFWLKNRQKNAWREKVDPPPPPKQKEQKAVEITFKMDRDIAEAEKNALHSDTITGPNA